MSAAIAMEAVMAKDLKTFSMLIPADLLDYVQSRAEETMTSRGAIVRQALLEARRKAAREHDYATRKA